MPGFFSAEAWARVRACPVCGTENGSTKPLWAERPALAVIRGNIGRGWGIPEGWWSAQPRSTAESGWIVASAAPSAERRSEL